jgi:hypothetical protein
VNTDCATANCGEISRAAEIRTDALNDLGDLTCGINGRTHAVIASLAVDGDFKIKMERVG